MNFENLSQSTKQSLLKSLYKFLENISKDLYSTEKLDEILMTLARTLSHSNNLSKENQNLLLQQIDTYQKLIDKKRKIYFDKRLKQKSKAVSENVENIYKTYIEISSQDFTQKEMDDVLLSVLKNIEDLKEFKFEIIQITEPEDDNQTK